MPAFSSKLKNRELNIIFLFLFVIANAIVFFKCNKGYPNVDEMFYLTVPYRFLLGDAPFVHEWHLSQMSGILLYPMVSFWYKLNGNLDGIVLFARQVFAVINCAYGAFIYLRLKSKSWISAVCVSLMCMLFVPFNIPVLSYNSIGVMGLLAALIIIYTAQTRLRLQYTVCGIFFALAVVCNPFLVFMYLAFAVYAFITLCKQKNSLPMKQFIFITLGCVIVALPFFAFILSRSDFADILRTFPLMFEDPEHEQYTILYKIKSYFGALVMQRIYLIPIYACLLVLFFICVFDKKRLSRRYHYFYTVAAFTVLLMVCHATFNHMSALMWSINLIGLFIFLLTDDAEIKNIFYHFWLPGMLYSFCMHMASNQRFPAITSGAAVAAAGTIMMLVAYANIYTERESTSPSCLLHKRLIPAIAAIIILFQVTSVAWFRYNCIFEDNSVRNQTEKIEDGIYRGMIVSKSKMCQYHNALYPLTFLDSYNIEKILHLDWACWYYLTDDCAFSSYSAWLGFIPPEDMIQRFEAYYSLYPDKMPDAVLATWNHDLADLFCERFGYHIDIFQEEASVLLPNE